MAAKEPTSAVSAADLSSLVSEDAAVSAPMV